MRKSQSSLIQYIFITLMSIVAIFFLINVFSSFFEDPYNSKIRDIHMNSIYTFIKDSDEIYIRENLNKECYFMLNLHSILDTQKDENILRGFVIKNDGIYKYDYNREDLKSREYENSYKNFNVNIKKDETSKNILNWFNSDEIEISDATYLKFTPRDERYLITAFIDNSQINLLEESNEKANELLNEELNERTKNDFDFSSPDDIMFVGETTKIEEDFDLNYDNFYLAYNPQNKNLFVSQNELTNFLLNENHCTRNELISDLKTEIAKEINPIFDEYVSVRYERFTCYIGISQGYNSFFPRDQMKNDNKRKKCEEFENKENDIKRQIDFIINDESASKDMITFKDEFYRNLKDFEKLNFEVLDEMKSIKNECSNFLELVKEEEENFNLRSQSAKDVEPILEEYLSKVQERTNCEYSNMNFQSIDETYINSCYNLKEEENKIKEEEIDFIVQNDISPSSSINFKSEFYGNLENFENLKFEILNELGLIKKECEKQILENEEDFLTKGERVENSCDIKEEVEKEVEKILEIVETGLYEETDPIIQREINEVYERTNYEFNKRYCENEDEREVLDEFLYKEQKTSCDIEKLENFENFYLDSISFQEENHKKHEEDFFKYYNDTKNEYYNCSDLECDLLEKQFDFYKKYIFFGSDYELTLTKIILNLESIKEFYFGDKDKKRENTYWENTCINLEEFEESLNDLDKNDESYKRFEEIYELNKKGCEDESLREEIFKEIYSKEQISCSLEKLESFENFYLSDFSFQNRNYENHREDFFKYLNNTKYEYYLCSNSNSQGCNLLNSQFEVL